jgi:hypothetical protein
VAAEQLTGKADWTPGRLPAAGNPPAAAAAGAAAGRGSGSRAAGRAGGPADGSCRGDPAGAAAGHRRGGPLAGHCKEAADGRRTGPPGAAADTGTGWDPAAVDGDSTAQRACHESQWKYMKEKLKLCA